MQIWSSEVKEIEKLYVSVKGHSPELANELERLIRTDDENIVLVYARRCLEVIVTDLCKNDLERPRKTELLHGIYDLAGVYAFLSEKDIAYENLRKFSQAQIVSL